MGVQTDYITLGFVAIVGIVAILSMANISPSASLTGNAVAESVQSAQDVADQAPIAFNPNRFVQASRHGNGDYDYDSDGWLTEHDSALLSIMIDTQRCSYKKDCDVDDDGDIDLFDLGRLNNIILSQ